jgi:peptidyl-prolyl cis-trans isomerase C
MKGIATMKLRAHPFGAASALLAAVAIAAASQAQPSGTADKGQRAAAKAAKLPTSAAEKRGLKPASPEARPAQLTEADLERRAKVLVTYKGGEVTIGELEDAIASQSPFMRERYRDPKHLKELLDKTVRFELLGQEAQRRSIDKHDSVQQAVKQNAVQSLMKAEFDDKMSAASIADADIAQYYQEHLSEYVQPAMHRVSHIMVSTEQEAKEVLAQAKTMDLRAFRQLARDKSIDEASKLRGGDLRYFDNQGRARGESDGAVPLPIVKAAFALKNVGDTAAAPVKIDGGYSIVKLTGQRPAISRKLEEVAETIRVRLWRERRQQAIEEFVAQLREQYKPETHAELAETVRLDEAESAHISRPTAPEEPGEAPH